MLLEGRPNASWCCNPQFRIAARKAGELLLCLSQRDPMLAHGAHVPKSRRAFQFGFQVSSFRKGPVKPACECTACTYTSPLALR